MAAELLPSTALAAADGAAPPPLEEQQQHAMLAAPTPPKSAGDRRVGLVFDRVMELHMREGGRHIGELHVAPTMNGRTGAVLCADVCCVCVRIVVLTSGPACRTPRAPCTRASAERAPGGGWPAGTLSEAAAQAGEAMRRALTLHQRAHSGSGCCIASVLSVLLLHNRPATQATDEELLACHSRQHIDRVR
jgi:hypothetical protein